MTDKVDPRRIEAIVGVERHKTQHFARAVTNERVVYILHSHECLASHADLRDCAFSIALDRGIEHHIPWSGWRRVPDRPVRVEVFRGWLVPDLLEVRASLREGAES